MGAWQETLTAALLGTDRETALPAVDGPPAALLGAVGESDPAARLLSTAAVSLLYERAGWLPPVEGEPLPPPCASEELPHCSDRAASYLRRILDGEQAELLGEWLAAAAAAGRLAPAELLPALLDLPGKAPEHRELILAVGGARIRWLAALNPDWSAAAPQDESAWELGDAAVRVAFLTRLRSQEADRARELLATGWEKEAPDDRAPLLATMRVGLSAADEPFIEQALDDRRKPVRQTAAGLLSRMAGSALCRRMIERLEPLLQFQAGGRKGFLGVKRGKATLAVELPAECDKPMQRDGIEPKAAATVGGQKVGDRAGWLIQMLAAVPPSVWAERWEASPGQILEAAAACKDWWHVLAAGLAEAALRHEDADWADALLGHFDWLVRSMPEAVGALMGLLDAARGEARLLGAVGRVGKWFGGQGSVAELLAACERPWSRQLTRAVLDGLRRQREPLDWTARDALARFALRMDPDEACGQLDAWADKLAAAAVGPAGAKMIDDFLARLRFRQGMLAALAEAGREE